MQRFRSRVVLVLSVMFNTPVALMGQGVPGAAPNKSEAQITNTQVYERVLGTWDCTVTNKDGESSYVLVLRLQKGALNGMLQDPLMGYVDIERPLLAGEDLTFELLGGRITYRLKVTRNTLDGTWTTGDDTNRFRGKKRPPRTGKK